MTRKCRSAWENGVRQYALDLIESIDESRPDDLHKILLNGAVDWKEYSYGGGALIYNMDIASRLCTASELKRTKDGQLRPNRQESWLDVQARALYQAEKMIQEEMRHV